MTYIRTWEGWLYLAVILDAYSRKVVGWAMADHLRTELVLSALEMALWNRRPAAGVIHHSDHGCQYTSIAFGNRCQEAGVAYFLKQLGKVLAGGRGKGGGEAAVLDGRRWLETPGSLAA